MTRSHTMTKALVIGLVAAGVVLSTQAFAHAYCAYDYVCYPYLGCFYEWFCF